MRGLAGAYFDHVLVTGPGPYYAPPAELDLDKAHRDVDAHLLLLLQVARNAAGRVRPGGYLAEEDLVSTLGRQLRVPSCEIDLRAIDTAVLEELPQRVAEGLQALPLRRSLSPMVRFAQPALTNGLVGLV